MEGLRFITARQAGQEFLEGAVSMPFVHGWGATCHVKYLVPKCV